MFEFEQSEITTLPEFEVPPKCEGCGVVCDSKIKLQGLLANKYVANHFAEHLVTDGDEFDAMIDENMPADIADEIKKQARNSVVDGLDNIDSEIESIYADINANTLACDGVLKMRATKGDATYTVSVCTSPRVYFRDSDYPMHTSTHVQVRSANK